MDISNLKDMLSLTRFVGSTSSGAADRGVCEEPGGASAKEVTRCLGTNQFEATWTTRLRCLLRDSSNYSLIMYNVYTQACSQPC